MRTFTQAKVKCLSRIFALMEECDISGMEVFAWSEATDAIAAAEEDDDEVNPHDVIDGNLDAMLDDPEFIRMQADLAHEALLAMGVTKE